MDFPKACEFALGEVEGMLGIHNRPSFYFPELWSHEWV